LKSLPTKVKLISKYYLIPNLSDFIMLKKPSE
jgi:hypothetical protein